MRNSPESLISARVLARSAVWSLAGDGLPLVVALFAIPQLIAVLGTDRFGILVIAWMVIGYLSLFDLGLGRSLTKFVAEQLGKKRIEKIPLLAGTAMAVMAVLGVTAGGGLALLAPWLAEDVLNVPDSVRGEAIGAMRWLAATTPFVITAAAMTGLLQAFQYFGPISAVRIALGIFTFVAPLAVLQFWDDLIAVTAALAIVRFCAWIALFAICLSVIPGLRSPSCSWNTLAKLLRFGSWLTVSNIIGPVMVYFDRFFIGAVLTMSAVTYYATPYEVVTRLWIVPTALTAVAFPAMATALVVNPQRAVSIFWKSTRAMIFALFPILIVLVLFAHEVLTAWLGSRFADNSTIVLQLLAVGVFINSFARVPFTLIQGHGRADLTAIVHLVELPVYVIGLWFAVRALGIEGAAVIWLVRIGVDAIVMTWLSVYLTPQVGRAALTSLIYVIGLTVLFGFAWWVSGLLWKVIVALLAGGTCLYLGWREFGSVLLGSLRWRTSA